MALSLLAMWRVTRKPGFNTAGVLLIVLVLDLGSFSWFYEWRYAGAPTSLPLMTADEQQRVDAIRRGPGRVLPLDAPEMPPNAVRPNSNIRYGIPSVLGYGPLLGARYAAMTGTDPTGQFPDRNVAIPLLDVLGVRWIAQQRAGSLEPQLLGSGCGAVGTIRRVRVVIPRDVAPHALRIVSHMSCSTTLPTGTEVARVHGRSGAGHPLAAGADTAEWAYDRPDVRATVAHARAHVAETFDAGAAVKGLWFDTLLRTDDQLRLEPGATIDIDLADTSALLRLKTVQALAPSGVAVDLPMTPVDVGAQADLSDAVSLPGVAQVRERRSFRGLAWAVCDARRTADADIAALLHGGRDVVGRSFNPFFTALVSGGAPRPTCVARPRVTAVTRRPGHIVVDVAGEGSSILVVSESYNGGWKARVDGHSAPVLTVDGVVMGVVVPSGGHKVEMRYLPVRFVYGVAVALVALASVLLLTGLAWRRGRAISREHA
jgi:hypothetical protein